MSSPGDFGFPTYWGWLCRGTGGKAGFLRILNGWLGLHAYVGLMLAAWAPGTLADASKAVLLPLAGVLVGLSFAWAGNASALLQTEEMERFSEFHDGGFTEFVYIYQTAILIILVTLIGWGLAGLAIFDQVWPGVHNERDYFITKAALYGLSSLSVRVCWHAVLGAQMMLLTRFKIRKLDRDRLDK